MKKSREIKPSDIWNKEKINQIKSFILQESSKQSLIRKVKNKILGVKYIIQDYINKSIN